MSEDLKMSYDDMLAEISNLSQYATDFETTTAKMTASVNTLCDNWTSASTDSYREDYIELANNFNQTLEVVRSLIQSTKDYINDMQAVDQAYSSSKVTRS